MLGFFQLCFVLGAGVLALQVLLSFVGLGAGSVLDLDMADVDHGGDLPDVDHGGDAPGDHGDASHAGAGDALNLLSVRSVAAATAVFGASGLGLVGLLPTWVAVVVSLLPALAAAIATAWVTQRMLGMQTSGTLRLARAVGREATVYLTVPEAAADDYGLIHVMLQGRTVELKAVTSEPRALPSGSTVVVLSVSDDGETAEVVTSSTFEELIDDHHD